VNTAANTRLLITKGLLWILVGAATTTGVYRLVLGLGATSALSDAIPWGLWKAFNVLACIPMAAGGFVIAGLVHCFHLRKYRPIVRPTVLIAFLGYMTAVTGLVLDIGKPWNIWRPIVYWNVHSPLFEVAWCIMLYATVMLAEFAPVLGERFGWQTFVRFMKKLTPVLAILAVAISTLHQSTLGTLFTLSPQRLHPLWASPIQNIIFFVSAIGMGLSFLSLLFLLTNWLYKRPAPWDIVGGLTRVAGGVLALYLILRLGDLAVRGRLGLALADTTAAWVFWLEIVLGGLAPALLFTLPATRGRSWAVTWGSLMAVAGLMMQRGGVGTFSQFPVVGLTYFPTPAEFAVTLGVVAFLALIFLFAVENLRVWEDVPARSDHFTPPAVDPLTRLRVGSPWLGAPQRAVLGWILGVLGGLAVMEIQLPVRSQPAARPVGPARRVEVLRTERAEGGHELWLTGIGVVRPAGLSGAAQTREALLLDSAGAPRYVLFDHERHESELGGRTSCAQCHHHTAPLELGTSCRRCHRDMYRSTDTFAHAEHEAAYGGRASCSVCHADRTQAKTRAGSKPCRDCHVAGSPPENARVQIAQDWQTGVAPGYAAALHGLCLDCHRREDVARGATVPRLALCSNCHRQATGEALPNAGQRPGWSLSASLISARAASTTTSAATSATTFATPEETRLVRRP